MTADDTGMSERERLAKAMVESEWWAVSSLKLADAILAAGYTRVNQAPHK